MHDVPLLWLSTAHLVEIRTLDRAEIGLCKGTGAKASIQDIQDHQDWTIHARS